MNGISRSRAMTDLEYIRSFHASLATCQSKTAVRREEYLDYMTFKSNERPMFAEIFGPIVGLKEEWRQQGATPQELDLSAFRYRCADEGTVPVNMGWMGGEEPVILDETDTILVYRDAMGRRMELSKRYATLALPMTHPVACMDDWLAIKHHYEFNEARLAGDWEQAARDYLASGRVVSVSIPGGYDGPRQLLGEEMLAVACYEEPELIHDMLATFAGTVVRLLERIARKVQVDQIFVHEDMAGSNGPLLGPKQVREFIVPYYRRVWDVAQEHGARLFKQDSDGDLRVVLPAFVDAGLNVIGPCEPAGGMNIVELRKQYGRKLAFLGGIDKHVLRRSREEISAELESKVPAMVRTGGCVLGLDHRIPNGTSLANYRFYIDKIWEIIDRKAA